MKLNRREFITGVTALATAVPGLGNLKGAGAEPTAPGLAGARSDFPWAAKETYLNAALEHPLGIHSARAMEKYIGYLTNGPDAGRDSFENLKVQEEAKVLFARLIRAKPSEIAYIPSTQFGENLVVDGMGIQAADGNVVTNDLHYDGILLHYRMRQKAGLDVRVVRRRDGQIDLRDMERVVDRKTKLISIALVSNVNGYLHDVKAISDLAHAHGAYLCVDGIQAAGAVPIDVRAMGIDFLACSGYKWLMGGRFGYLYVREDLQGTVLKPTQFGSRGSDETTASRYQVSTASHLGRVCQQEALQYILRLGVENIRRHVRPLTGRLQKELPALGYPSMTPPGTESPIVSFVIKDPEAVRARLERAKVIVTVRDHLRVSPSVYNNQADIDRLIEALA